MYENKTYEAIKNDILSKILGIDTREGSFANDMVSPISAELESSYNELDKLLLKMFLENLSSEDLERRCEEYGLTRKSGTLSEGFATFTGVQGTVIPVNTLISTTTGLNYVTTIEGIVAAGGTVDIKIQSVDVGTKYNILANTINIINVSINGITSVINKESISGGTDIETDEELKNRLLLQLRTPATSGNKEHYKLWSMEVNGIGDARVFPLAGGAGTVLVMPITTDKRAPSETIINNVINKIEEKRPIGAAVTVQAPTEILINVDATLIIDTNFTLQSIIDAYAYKFNNYIAESAFKINTVDYYKCLSLFYEIEGVKTVTIYKLNNDTKNISIGDKEIQVAGNINITV